MLGRWASLKILHLTRPAAGGMREYIMTLLEALAKWDYQLYLAGPVEGWDRSRLQGVEFFPLEIGSSVSGGSSGWFGGSAVSCDGRGSSCATPMVIGQACWRGSRGRWRGCESSSLSTTFCPRGGSGPSIEGLERVMEPWPVARVAVCEAIRHHYARAMGLSARANQGHSPGPGLEH